MSEYDKGWNDAIDAMQRLREATEPPKELDFLALRRAALAEPEREGGAPMTTKPRLNPPRWLRLTAWWTLKILQMPFAFICWLLEEAAERTGA